MPLALAVLYQNKPARFRAPAADIAHALHALGRPVITRRDAPRPREEYDWIFADSIEGVRAAAEAGAKTLWLNSAPISSHPAYRAGLAIVGQSPELHPFREPEFLNEWLRKNGFAPQISPEFSEAITFHVLPAGAYSDGNQAAAWCFSSSAPEPEALRAAAAQVGQALKIRAPISIDAARGAGGECRLFNLNLSPDLSGPGRPGREAAASPFVRAAQAHGWSYGALLENLAAQAWR
ncbi:MAG: hypothetical protein EOP11_11085 [Proteobacteria bacterium]|nr:MAG: hypothetical protein EOP11_11085 [Pseudomonadota bacterium]